MVSEIHKDLLTMDAFLGFMEILQKPGIEILLLKSLFLLKAFNTDSAFVTSMDLT